VTASDPGTGVRVVSLVPSVTETLLAWGVDVVACTRFCEQPRLRHVGGTKDPDIAAVVALAPDLVVVDEEENRLEDADALVAAGLDLHVLAVRDVAVVGAQLGALARAVGADTGALARWSPPPPAAGPRRRAFVPIWRRPWMALGPDTYGSTLLAALGVDNVLTAADGRYPEVALDEIAGRGVEIVLAPSEPYPFKERHVAELSAVAPVVLVAGLDLFWWGVRTPQAFDRLRAAVGALGA
jgi:ABC-type Fe3+-hydroxamate transport system substrate-binding protein